MRFRDVIACSVVVSRFTDDDVNGSASCINQRFEFQYWNVDEPWKFRVDSRRQRYFELHRSRSAEWFTEREDHRTVCNNEPDRGRVFIERGAGRHIGSVLGLSFRNGRDGEQFLAESFGQHCGNTRHICSRHESQCRDRDGNIPRNGQSDVRRRHLYTASDLHDLQPVAPRLKREYTTMKRYVLAALAVLLTAALAPERAAAATTVTITTSGGVTFPAQNPSTQFVTPASTALVATITINGAKNNGTWNLMIRGANSNFTGTSGAPISISNVHWTASGAVLAGNGTVSVTSGQINLNTADTLVASGIQGNRTPCTIQITFNLTINNSWTYDADTYLQNLILTASVQ
jgi:hypothetical protein